MLKSSDHKVKAFKSAFILNELETL